ncbi:MAG: 3-deoxy-manno-octulosonate cytidylyltransferase [Xanthomonadales bacterium]|nr:3-deoxy-manno-octulosonate cytidylyltransferase [Xanthomonadales bacterium]NIN60677.1 3-deoxy-manno-octulosonate cytidylyltransferase [Xanthomonadales bacterium]NIN75538.1 3-deoxy-manno-octulosonate cytidylyltransferase [Xanthomonadales bacterium]NIO15298.1 3-deoxy-manno-octulosonate cytidylyltransferase [Xanthomonadales bacterium]NIP13070.1 3-deoxy-manno-octulosonate cytidylyltransferase [Xanthomonadales bacterium]
MSIPGYVIVIPARYESQRLPGKALLDIAGKPLIEHVWDCARRSAAGEVIIATDDRRIAKAASEFGAEAVMTSSAHRCGSERIAECAGIKGWGGEQIIVNLQGDEPLMPPECLDQVAGLLARSAEADAATLYCPIEDAREVTDPNVVKLVADKQGRALLFSRAAIPCAREHPDATSALEAGVRWLRHLGVYAYRKDALDRFVSRAPTPLEETERLEQLRILEHGGVIQVAEACRRIPAGVDTPEDLERVRNQLM